MVSAAPFSGFLHSVCHHYYGPPFHRCRTARWAGQLYPSESCCKRSYEHCLSDSTCKKGEAAVVSLYPVRIWLKSDVLSLSGFYLSSVCSRAERSFAVVSINAIVFPLIDVYSAIAAGLGFGAMQSFFYYAVILAHTLGPGALYSGKCTAFSSAFAAAWNALLFNSLHILLMIIAFDAYRQMFIPKIVIMILLHAAATSFVRKTTARQKKIQHYLHLDSHSPLVLELLWYPVILPNLCLSLFCSPFRRFLITSKTVAFCRCL
jgi:hypothetical protein